MQPVQYDVRCSAEKTCSISEPASPLRHLDEAITRHFATSRRHPEPSLRTWQHNMATFMQPFHCDLHPKIQQTHRTTYTRSTMHLQNREEEPIVSRQTAAASLAYPMYLLSPAGATLHGKTQGFVPQLPPKTKPAQHPCSHFHPFSCVLQHHVVIPNPLYAHGNTTWQRSCSHSTAICHQEFKNRIQLRTREEPFIAERKGGTNRVQHQR